MTDDPIKRISDQLFVIAAVAQLFDPGSYNRALAEAAYSSIRATVDAALEELKRERKR